MAVIELGALLDYQQVRILNYISATFGVACNLSSTGGLIPLTRNLTAQEVTQLQAQVAIIKASPNPAVYVGTTVTDLKARLISAYPGLRGKTVAEIRAIVAAQIGGWGTLANAKTDLQQWMPDLIAAVLVLILNGE